MNQTEQQAKEWLKKQGYKENEIIFQVNKSPDFVCLDGKRYEVKLLYSTKLIFYETQTRQLRPTDIILVFNKDGYFNQFLWRDKNKVSYEIDIVKKCKKETTIRLEYSTKELLDACGNRGESYNSIIKKLIKWFKQGLDKTIKEIK